MTQETDRALLKQFVSEYVNAVDNWQKATKGHAFLAGMGAMQPVLQTVQMRLQALTLTTPQAEYARCLIDGQLAQNSADIQKILDNPGANRIDENTPGTMDYYYGEHGAWFGGRDSQLKQIQNDCGGMLKKGFDLNDRDATHAFEKECKTHHLTATEQKSMDALVAEYHRAPFVRNALPGFVLPASGASIRARE